MTRSSGRAQQRRNDTDRICNVLSGNRLALCIDRASSGDTRREDGGTGEAAGARPKRWRFTFKRARRSEGDEVYLARGRDSNIDVGFVTRVGRRIGVGIRPNSEMPDPASDGGGVGSRSG